MQMQMKTNQKSKSKSTDKEICKRTIVLGAILRVILTVVTFWLISTFISSSSIFIVLPIALTILDYCDNIPNLIYSWYSTGVYKNTCTPFFEYQSMDKVNDWASYILAWYWFELDPVFLALCLIRGLGVFGFIQMKKSYPLIIFPDVLKEYIVYRYFIPRGFNWLPAVILAKLGFEFYFHTTFNASSY